MTQAKWCVFEDFLLLLATLEKSYVNLIIKALRDKLPPLLRFRSFAESSVNVAVNNKVKKEQSFVIFSFSHLSNGCSHYGVAENDLLKTINLCIMEFYKVDLDSIFALVLIFGLIPSFVLTAVIQYLKNRRYKIERQTELMAKMIEKGDSTNLDFKSMAEALQEPTKHGNLKRSVLNNLRWGSIFSFVGLGLLGVALYAHMEGDGGATAAFLTFGAIIGGVGLALLITFLVAKKYLKKEVEKEEKELAEEA